MESAAHRHCAGDIFTRIDTSEIIRSLRVDHGMTQGELERLSGIPQSVLSMYESGKRIPTVENLDRVLMVFQRALRVGQRPSRQSDRSVTKTIEIHRIVLRKMLHEYDGVIEHGRKRLEQIRRRNDPHEQWYLDRWDELLSGDPVDLVRLLSSTDEEDVELLKMSPFSTMLSKSEQAEVIDRSRKRLRGTRRLASA